MIEGPQDHDKGTEDHDKGTENHVSQERGWPCSPKRWVDMIPMILVGSYITFPSVKVILLPSGLHFDMCPKCGQNITQ